MIRDRRFLVYSTAVEFLTHVAIQPNDYRLELGQRFSLTLARVLLTQLPNENGSLVGQLRRPRNSCTARHSRTSSVAPSIG